MYRFMACLQGTYMEILQGLEIDPDNLIVMSGSQAVLDAVFHSVADEGDAILIPAPYYPGFDYECGVRGALVALAAGLFGLSIRVTRHAPIGMGKPPPVAGRSRPLLLQQAA
jgi:Aminotransferase class I and II